MPPPIFTRVPSFRLPSVRRCNRTSLFKKVDNNIVDDVNVIESESKKCSSSSESEDENELEEGEIVASDVSVNDDSEDDSDDITNWAIHDDESRQRSDRSRKHLEYTPFHKLQIKT
ncbi:hypothetical protein P8452_49071 [Trifolium repens]|nr:hypothetical protein P8452_49071 [Trifolium repens]